MLLTHTLHHPHGALVAYENRFDDVPGPVRGH